MATPGTEGVVDPTVLVNWLVGPLVFLGLDMIGHLIFDKQNMLVQGLYILHRARSLFLLRGQSDSGAVRPCVNLSCVLHR
jgi:hypothetical protein